MDHLIGLSLQLIGYWHLLAGLDPLQAQGLVIAVTAEEKFQEFYSNGPKIHPIFELKICEQIYACP